MWICPFFYWVVYFLVSNCLCTLEINPLLVALFTSIFSHFETKEARIYNGKNTVSSIICAGKTGQFHVKE